MGTTMPSIHDWPAERWHIWHGVDETRAWTPWIFAAFLGLVLHLWAKYSPEPEPVEVEMDSDDDSDRSHDFGSSAADEDNRTINIIGLGLKELNLPTDNPDGAREVLVIKLAGNKFSSLPPQIAQFEALVELFVSANRLTRLPPEIGQLKALRRLHACDNRLSKLPEELGGCCLLKELYLSENKLTNLPDSIWPQLTQLKSLWLDFNRLSSLPATLGECASLQQLKLSVNPSLGRLPDEICNLPLQELTVTQCGLGRLPARLGYLRMLLELRAGSNNLIGIPRSIGDCEKLQVLALDRNLLVGIPNEIGLLSNLCVCALGSNPLKAPSPKICAKGVKAIQEWCNSEDDFVDSVVRKGWVSAVTERIIGQ